MIGFLSSIQANVKTLLDRWTLTLANRVDANITSRADATHYTQTRAERIDAAITSRMKGVIAAPTEYTTGTGTFTPTGGIDSWCRVTLVGGGGGGGGKSSSGNTAGGGGGQTIVRWVRVPAAGWAYSVGAGGAGGNSSGGDGSNGQPTKLGPLLACGGGKGLGSGATPTYGGIGGGYVLIDTGAEYSAVFGDGTSVVGGAGAVANGGFAAGFGSPESGSGSFNRVDRLSSGSGGGGGGGGSCYGVGGNGATTPSTPSGYGGGGGGADGSNTAGATGAGGIIIIEQYGALY